MTRKDNRQHNRELLQDVFDAAYRAMKDARGTRHTESTDYYVDAAAVRRAVEGALRKAECDSLDWWRG